MPIEEKDVRKRGGSGRRCRGEPAPLRGDRQPGAVRLAAVEPDEAGG